MNKNFHLNQPHIHLHLPGMGLVPAESRKVKVMPSYLKGLVPPPTDNNITLKPGNADTERDTMPLIISKASRTAYQVSKLALKLKGKTLAETLKNDSSFILDYIRYKKDDPMNEQVRSPRRLVWEGAGDCDCYAVFLAAVLINQGIPFKFRIAKYNSGAWSHIYIIVPHANGTHTTLDPVTNKHDYEVPFKDKRDYDMSGKTTSGLSGGLQFLDGGFGCPCGVPSKENEGTTKPKKVVVSGKSLELRDVEPATNLLNKIGLPYTKKADSAGNIVYDVATPGGSKLVPGIIPIAPAEQQKITSDLVSAPAGVNAGNGAVNKEFTPAQKTAAWSALAVLGIAAVVLSSMRSGEPSSENGMGSLPRKKVAYLKI